MVQESDAISLDQVLEEIGLGNRMAYIVAKRLTANRLTANKNLSLAAVKKESDRIGSIDIRGSEGVVMSYAKCCHPIPGDPIIAHISSGRGLVVHTDDCNNIAEFRDDPEKFVSAAWDPGVTGEFSV